MLAADTWHLVRTETGKPEVLVCFCQLAKPLRSQEAMQAAHDGCWQTQPVALRRVTPRLSDPLLASKGKSACSLSLILQNLSLKTPSEEIPRGEGGPRCLHLTSLVRTHGATHSRWIPFQSSYQGEVAGENKRLGLNSKKHQYF